MTDYAVAILLGIIEGLTEFIPVSSTGHLILAAEALHFTGEKEKAFDVFIQLGAIMSVVVIYKERFAELFRQLFPLRQWFSKDTWLRVRDIRGSAPLNIFLVSLPALIIGGLFHKKLKLLFTPGCVAAALILGGIAFILVERMKPRVKTISFQELSGWQSFVIGCFQSLALWPGTSRSGATLVGAMLLGVDRAVAAEFSFLAAVPLIAAAALLDFVKVLPFLTAQDLSIFSLGLGVSFIGGCLSIRLLIGVLKRYSLAPFAYYRIVLGIIVLILS
jgi:undecaprenyl-diphosphatase